jgi:hypothetical protein
MLLVQQVIPRKACCITQNQLHHILSTPQQHCVPCSWVGLLGLIASVCCHTSKEID